MATKKKTTAKTKTAAPKAAAPKAAPKAAASKTAPKTAAPKAAPKAAAPKAAKVAAKPAKAAKAEKPAKAAKAENPVKAAAKPAKAGKSTPDVRSAPKTGSRAPAFKLAADDGSEISLDSLAGKNIVLYFYPRDATPGCTIEACGFRDAHDELEKHGAVVLGVSRDSIASHAKFRANQNLPFNLLSDPTGEMISAYGSWGEKSFMGRKSMGILRTTVLIDGTGTVRKVYPKVSPKVHADEVLKDLEALG